MLTILVLNAKGGAGKTTIATNLAGALTSLGHSVALADCDPQASSLDWLAERPAGHAHIHGIDARRRLPKTPPRADFLIIDAPSGTYAHQLTRLVQQADRLIMPVLPSPLDIRAANRFLAELLGETPLTSNAGRLTTVANRVREGNRFADTLEDFLEGVRFPKGRKVPMCTVLRASQNYVRAAERGLSVFEFAPFATALDREQWRPLLKFVMAPTRRGRRDQT